MCLAREEKVVVHYTRRHYEGNNKLVYVPCKIPTNITKETMKSAFNQYFAEMVLGDEDAEEYIIQVIKKIREQNWSIFEFNTDETIDDAGYKCRVYVCIKDKCSILKLIVKRKYQIIIKDDNFNPQNSQERRYKNVWRKIMNVIES